MGLYDKIFKPKKLVLANGKVVEEKCSRAPLIIILIVIATWISVKVTGFSMTTLVTRIRFFFDILAQMFPPKVGYISSIWGPLFDTIKMSLLGSFVGGVLAIPFAILASSNLIKNKVVIGVVRVFLSIVRTIRRWLPLLSQHISGDLVRWQVPLQSQYLPLHMSENSYTR